MTRPAVFKRSDLYPAEASAAAVLCKQKEKERRQKIAQQAHADVTPAMCSLTDQEAHVYRRAAIEALMGIHVWKVENAPHAALLAEIDRIFGAGGQ